MTLAEWLKQKLGYATPEPVETKPIQPDTPRSPEPMISPLPTVDIDWNDWALKSAYISSTFEGRGGDYANPTGNFDGAYLTVGLLGLTWKYSNQQPMIKAFVDKYGLKELKKYMPESGEEYYAAAKMSESAGGKIVAKWSSGSSVKEPYRSELIKFWSSPIMVEAQDKRYATMMGIFAKKMALEYQNKFHLELPLFEHYAFFWDQAVLNGTGLVIPFEDYKKVSTQTILDFIKNPVGFNVSSNRENYKLWSAQINNGLVDDRELVMFKLAYLRAMKSRSSPGQDFRGTVLMRRGTLALGLGVVNGSRRNYDWQLPANPTNEKPPATDKDQRLMEMAKSVGLEEQMKTLLKYSEIKGIARGANYWGIFNLGMHSSKKRFYEFDVKGNKIKTYLCAHGVGSEGSKDDGYAEVFSNTPNSRMSSLGIYQASEEYEGKHGRSIRLDGLQSTNSNARLRAVVIHTADYVSQTYINNTGRIGRSDGCLAFENQVRDEIVNKFKGGSLILAFK